MAFFFIFAAVILRIAPYIPTLDFLPHIPNFMPIAAIALFSAVYLNRKYALGLPLLIMFFSDFFIGFYNIWIMLSVYGSFILIGLGGLWLRKHKNVPNVIGITIGGSILFYLLTNFAMWAIPHSLYPHTFNGLILSYIMGLPFFRNTLMGDLFYVGSMFGLYELVLYYYYKKAKPATAGRPAR